MIRRSAAAVLVGALGIATAGCAESVAGTATPDPAATTTTTLAPPPVTTTRAPVTTTTTTTSRRPAPFGDACALLTFTEVRTVLKLQSDSQRDPGARVSLKWIARDCLYLDRGQATVGLQAYYLAETPPELQPGPATGDIVLEQVAGLGVAAQFVRNAQNPKTHGIRVVTTRATDSVNLYLTYSKKEDAPLKKQELIAAARLILSRLR
ncbi:hypothetical protein EV193_101989 [Herbihabitans rhizosphaerae]|uniref:DUF3558 domain-containing protein n=1 Tax=Herbihabitans rhizosphaerae TaxID=1872711 RepID=A0A4Q7L9I6_9PSEU|nr:hypothetical protein [Herbihabitans rhizosphaerae]RZS45102.1 hypothetical protein EV193_101989 [Herbihabitans rhizosphaerae]